MEKLKPCPFCGGKAEYMEHFVNGDPERFISCSKCDASSPTTSNYVDWEDSIKAWNKRIMKYTENDYS